MKFASILFSFVLILFTLSDCSVKSSKNNKEIQPETYEKYIQKGNEISGLAQSVLLANVGKAIQKGGTEYAVEFCNLRASSITDSLNLVNNVQISRVSDKNRHPDNNLKSEKEKKLWDTIAEQIKSGTAGDTLIRMNNKLVYYKPIKTAMPACIKCHGAPATDIEPATFEKLQKLYPNDLATGYGLNDFRGLWKIEFSE